MKRPPALLLLLASLALPAQAQTVWRCAAGVYSDRPCTDGREIDVADPRGEEQRLQATLVALRGQQLAEDLRAERLVRQAQAIPLPAAAAAPKQFKPTPDRTRPKAQPRQRPGAGDGTWRAAAPSSRRTQD